VACLASNFWPGDDRSVREILQSMEMQTATQTGILNQMVVMNQVIMEDKQLQAKLKKAYEKRARSMMVLLANPTVALKFAQETLKTLGLPELKIIGEDGRLVDPNLLLSLEGKKDD